VTFAGLLGTPILLALLIGGFLQVPVWWIAVAGIVNAFVGMHAQPGKAEVAKDRGLYWKIVLGSIPLQMLFAAIVFGVGYAVGLLFS